MAMSGSDLSVASYDNKNDYFDEIWSPAPTSKKSKAKYPCKGPPKLNFLYFPPIAASAAALFGLDTYEELGGISQFYYPFPSGKCPKLASSTFYDAAVAAGGYGIATIFASQSGNLYVAYYTSNGTGAIDEFPVGSTTPTTLGLLPSEFDFVAGGGIGNLAVDSLGHLIVTNASPDCNVRVFARDFRSSYHAYRGLHRGWIWRSRHRSGRDRGPHLHRRLLQRTRRSHDLRCEHRHGQLRLRLLRTISPSVASRRAGRHVLASKRLTRRCEPSLPWWMRVAASPT